MVDNRKHKIQDGLSSGELTSNFITTNEIREVENKVFNFLVIYNASDGFLLVQLNNDSNERYPLPANSGRLIINKEDNIPFHSLQLVEPNSTAVTGKIYITYGRL